MALQERFSIARRNDKVGDLFGQEPPEPRHSLEFLHLAGHGLLERAVPVGKLVGLVQGSGSLPLNANLNRTVGRRPLIGQSALRLMHEPASREGRLVLRWRDRHWS